MIQIALNGRTLRPARYAEKPQDAHWLLDTLEAALILAPVKGDHELRFQLRELSYLTWTPSYLQLLRVAPHLDPTVPAIRPDAMDWLMENHRLVGLAGLDDGLYDRLAAKNGWTAAELMRITLATCATVAQRDPITWLAALLETHPDRYRPARRAGCHATHWTASIRSTPSDTACPSPTACRPSSTKADGGSDASNASAAPSSFPTASGRTRT